MSETLAIAGGERAVPEGAVRPWPPIEEIDRKMVLAMLSASD